MNLLISCGTSNNVNILPKLNFPDFPIDPDCIDYTVKVNDVREYSLITFQWKQDKSKIVTLPYWFYEDLISYEIDCDKVFQQYEYLRLHYVPTVSELQ